MQDLSLDLSCIEEEHPTPRKEISTKQVNKKIGIENILDEFDRRESLEVTIKRIPNLPPKDPNAQGPRKTVFKKFFKVNQDSIIKPRQKLSPIVLSNLDLSAEQNNPDAHSTTSRSPRKNQDSVPASFTTKMKSVESLPQVQLKDAPQLGSLQKFSSVKPSVPLYQPPLHIKLSDNSQEESFSKNQLMGKIKPRRMNTNVELGRLTNINSTLMTPANNRNTTRATENDYEFTPGSLKENLIKTSLHGNNQSLIPTKKNSSINFELPYISSPKGIFRPQFNIDVKKSPQRYHRNNSPSKQDHEYSPKGDHSTTAYQYTEDSPRAASKLNYNSPDEIVSVSRGSDFALKNILEKRSTRNLKSMLNSTNSGIDFSSRFMTDFSPKASQPLPISFTQTKAPHLVKIQDHNSVFRKVAEHGLAKPIYYA